MANIPLKLYQSTNKLRLRVQLMRHLKLYEIIPIHPSTTKEYDTHFANLFGYQNYTELCQKHTEEDSTTMRALMGPHCKTIYKAILARRDMKECLKVKM